ncbi:MAG: hypothetical protein ACI39Q_06870 [Wujia sp.]
MNVNKKKIICLLFTVALIFSLTGCKDKKIERYQNYVKSLISINYMGATEDYIKATGANREDAEALYQANIEHLTDNILAYYNVTISDASDMRQGYMDLARNIYSKVNYKVSEARKDGSAYLVDVTIYPINIFSQSSEDITTYIDGFNTRVKDGDYNEYTLEQYETEFSTGMLEILNQACINMTYADPVTVTVEIIEDGDTFYISDRDFLAIDAAMISTAIQTDVSTATDAAE